MTGNGKNRIWIVLSVAVTAFVVILAYVWISSDGPGVTYESTVGFKTDDGLLLFNCEVADTEQERALGLMNRETLNEDSGMLFVFETPKNLTFWMKNTLIPLDIVFIDESGFVINVEQAEPEPGVPDSELARYPSAKPAKWVVELNLGTCTENGIIPGSEVTITMYAPET